MRTVSRRADNITSEPIPDARDVLPEDELQRRLAEFEERIKAGVDLFTVGRVAVVKVQRSLFEDGEPSHA